MRLAIRSLGEDERQDISLLHFVPAKRYILTVT